MDTYRLLVSEGAALVFCSHHGIGEFIRAAQAVGFDVKNLLVWDKMWFGMGHNWRPKFEMILVLTKGRFVTKSKDKSNILSYRRLHHLRMVHPTEKPTPLLEELIDEPDYNPQTILDPFMGSGTTGVAAMNLGRRFIGIELDAKYFEIAKDRIETAYLLS